MAGDQIASLCRPAAQDERMHDDALMAGEATGQQQGEAGYAERQADASTEKLALPKQAQARDPLRGHNARLVAQTASSAARSRLRPGSFRSPLW